MKPSTRKTKLNPRSQFTADQTKPCHTMKPNTKRERHVNAVTKHREGYDNTLFRLKSHRYVYCYHYHVTPTDVSCAGCSFQNVTGEISQLAKLEVKCIVSLCNKRSVNSCGKHRNPKWLRTGYFNVPVQWHSGLALFAVIGYWRFQYIKHASADFLWTSEKGNTSRPDVKI